MNVVGAVTTLFVMFGLGCYVCGWLQCGSFSQRYRAEQRVAATLESAGRALSPVRVAADRVPAPAPVVVNVVIPGLPQPAPVMWPGVVEGQIVHELPPVEWRPSGGR